MFATYVSLALLAASSVSGLVVPRTPKQPAHWWKGLESYTEYNARYNALGCAKQHNTAFFDACCHPLLKSQSLTSRPAKCNLASVSPTATSSSVAPSATDDDDDDCDDGPEASTTVTATSALPTETGDDDDDDCDDGPESSSATITATSAAPTTTDDGDDDCEPCDNDDDDDCVDVPVSSTFSASSTPAPTSTLAPVTPTPSSTPVSSRLSTRRSTRVSSTSSSTVTSTIATPTSTVLPTSTPTPTSSKPSTTSSKAPATSTSPAPSSDILTGGFATYFFQRGVAGACGKVNGEDALIAAIDERRYGNPGVKSSLCGQQVRVTNTKNKKSVVVTIADDCPTCTNKNSIDLSQGAFNKIATEEEGMVPVTLEFI